MIAVRSKDVCNRQLSAYLTKSLLPAIVGHVLGDAVLLPAYAFHKPAFIWSSLAASPLWSDGSASTLVEKVLLILRAMAPSALLEVGPMQRFAVLAWVFLISTALTSVGFVVLARVARKAWEPAA